MILVVSSSEDEHAKRVRAEMQRRGIAVGDLEPSAFGGLGSVSVVLTGIGEIEGSKQHDGRRVLAEDIRAVYCPTPTDPKTSGVLDELWDLLDVGVVPGGSAAVEQALSTERQMRVAEKVGFEILRPGRDVPEATHLQVVVAGYRVFGAAIHAWKDGTSDITPAVLPVALAERCRELTEELGLVFAVMDVVIGVDGRAVFAELDPYGDWCAIEDATALPITRALVDVLLTEASGVSDSRGERFLSVHPSKVQRRTPFMRVARARS